jgi:hypothetical protein
MRPVGKTVSDLVISMVDDDGSDCRSERYHTEVIPFAGHCWGPVPDDSKVQASPTAGSMYPTPTTIKEDQR